MYILARPPVMASSDELRVLTSTAQAENRAKISIHFDRNRQKKSARWVVRM